MTTIKIGNTMPYSGPASAYGVIGKTESAYFRMVNDLGGINGRQIEFISYDDANSPPKTAEQVRKLVEGDEVLFMFNPLGTTRNGAIQKYLNAKKIPQLFVASGASKWDDPARYPWTMGFQPNYRSEGRIFASYILANYPSAKIAILYQNDDFGKDEIKGIRDGLGKSADMIVASASVELTDPTVDSQIVSLKSSGADLLITLVAPKAASQSLRKLAELGWKPVHLIANVASSIGSVLKPAGLENAKGLVSTAYLKDPSDPAMKDDLAVKAWSSFMDKYYPEGDRSNSNVVFGYVLSQAILQVLRQCGDDLSRENIRTQAANLRNLNLDMLLPGITVNTAPDDYSPIEQMQLMTFDGTSWNLQGEVLTGEGGSRR
ncbi:ABC transporter substrate-binding protein [Bradyrhizobium sp. Ai1a-2]|uniref:ABC transporter substrate-binding protein n=1 Tax=Bradyrhizobium sp. Ai1a-2 TaxID=196490 RepID=UPI0021107888|nr:ABC transporter substrate-binding protein [Bradyrhizobium sp. Ai1a-2]